MSQSAHKVLKFRKGYTNYTVRQDHNAATLLIMLGIVQTAIQICMLRHASINFRGEGVLYIKHVKVTCNGCWSTFQTHGVEISCVWTNSQWDVQCMFTESHEKALQTNSLRRRSTVIWNLNASRYETKSRLFLHSKTSQVYLYLQSRHESCLNYDCIETPNTVYTPLCNDSATPSLPPPPTHPCCGRCKSVHHTDLLKSKVKCNNCALRWNLLSLPVTAMPYLARNSHKNERGTQLM